MQGRLGNQSVPPAPDWWWIFDPRCSLRARAALSVGVGAVAFTLLLSWITGTLYRRTLENHLASNFETLAFQIADKLDRTVYDRTRGLQLAANLAVIRDPAAQPADRRRVLDALLESTPEFAWVGITDASGRILAGTNRLFENTVAGTRPWFLGAREKPFVGSPRDFTELARQLSLSTDDESANRFLDLAVPVTDANGQFAGVLVAHMRWNWSRDVQVSVVPDSAAGERIGVTVYGAGRDVLLDSGASGWTQPPEAPSVGEGRRFRGSILETPPEGVTFLTGYARSRGFREYRGIGWLTVVRQPIDRAFAGVGPLRRGIILGGCVLAILGSSAGWIIAGRHARRLRSVRAAAERIHEGDILSVLPRPKGGGEVAAMCGALGDLVEDLREKREKLTAENSRLVEQARERESARQ